MRLLIAIGCLLVALPFTNAAEAVKIGSEIDFTATALQTLDITRHGGACRSMGTKEMESFVGFTLVHLKQSDAALKKFGDTLATQLQADHWKIELNWSSGFSPADGWPYQVFVQATRGNATMELFVTFFFEPGSKTNISYSQRHSR